ncbi:hypothetical protein C2W62_36355 [Candidatus Entotheonella serta]|nr:hypothetical protein C2W62_36355 [Candidatus Entotheonella serta]
MESILIKAGQVFDGVADRALEHAYVIVKGDVIAALGAQSELSRNLETFAREIDLGPDVTLMPGLINMHTHMSFSSGENMFATHQAESVQIKLIRAVENLQLALCTGVTTIRDCGTLNHIAFATRDAVENGLLRGPRVIASGDGVTTTGGHLWFCGIEADCETEVRRAVRAQAKARADFIKVFATGGQTTPGTNSLEAQYTEAELCALTEEARRLGMRVAAHAHGTPGVRNAIAARVTTIEHCSFRRPVGVEYEPEQGRIMADAGIYVCPTISRGRSKFFDPSQAVESEEVATYYANREQRYQLVRQLIEDGVQIVSGSDAGIPYNTFNDYPGDLVLTVEGVDLSPLYVLKSATSVAAEALGCPDLGVVAPGKAADLLAVRGNPLQHIRALLEPQMVMARGQVVAYKV